MKAAVSIRGLAGGALGQIELALFQAIHQPQALFRFRIRSQRFGLLAQSGQGFSDKGAYGSFLLRRRHARRITNLVIDTYRYVFHRNTVTVKL
jgi:hypothetical protein